MDIYKHRGYVYFEFYRKAIIENLGNLYFIGTSKILMCVYQILIKIYYSAEYTNLTVMYLPLNANFSL